MKLYELSEYIEKGYTVAREAWEIPEPEFLHFSEYEELTTSDLVASDWIVNLNGK